MEKIKLKIYENKTLKNVGGGTGKVKKKKT